MVSHKKRLDFSSHLVTTIYQFYDSILNKSLIDAQNEEMLKDRVLLVPVQCCLLFMNFVCMIQRSLKTSIVLIAL